MKVIYSDIHAVHAPEFESDGGFVGRAYELAERGELIRSALAGAGGYSFLEPTDHGTEPISAIHDAGLMTFLATAWDQFSNGRHDRRVLMPDTFHNTHLREGMESGRVPGNVRGAAGHFAQDAATPIMAGTYAASRAAVDVALTASDHVLAGERYAYGLCRPPGHHAAHAMYGGYCYFNNAAIVAHDIVRRTGAKACVLDVDYHHGNGTQQIFYQRDDVLFVSLHADPDRAYPYFSGWADEVGAGIGRGSTLNLPQAPQANDDAFLGGHGLAQALDAIAKFGPTTLVVSLGVDAFDGDPIGDLKVSTQGFGRVGSAISQLNLPTVVLQEGGYNLQHLGANVLSFLNGLQATAG